MKNETKRKTSEKTLSVEGNFWWRRLISQFVCWSMCVLMVNRNEIMLIEKDRSVSQEEWRRRQKHGRKQKSDYEKKKQSRNINIESKKLAGATLWLSLQRHNIHNLCCSSLEKTSAAFFTFFFLFFYEYLLTSKLFLLPNLSFFF